MKKVIYIVGIIALIAAMMVMPVAATTWDVYEGGSIQAALNTASDGDTIFVHTGTYILPSAGGSIRLCMGTPNITLKGEGADVVTIDSNGGTAISLGVSSTPPYPTVPAPGGIVEGFKIVNASVGIAVPSENSPNCIIRNNVFDDISSRAVGTNAPNTTIAGNVMDMEGNNDYAIITYVPITFVDNIVSNVTGQYCAVYIRASDSIIVNNTIVNSKCSALSSRALTIREASNCTVTDNTITNNNGDGIRIWKTSAANNIIIRNNISSNGGIIYLKDAGEGNKVYLNDFVDNPAGVTYSGTPPTTTYWNSTEEIGYTYGGTTYTNYLGNYWSDYGGGDTSPEDGIGDIDYDIPGSGTDKDYRPLMAGYENYLGEPAAEPPHLVTYTISNRTITPPQTSEIDVEFSEEVSYKIAIEKDTATIYDWTGTAKKPNTKVWDGTYEVNSSVVPDGDYTVNVTGTNTTTGLSVVNNTEVITVVITEPDLTPTAIVTPANIFATESNSINATIKNNGSGDAGAFNVSLSADGTVVGRTGVAGLGAGNSKEVTFEWTPAASGTYELCVVADCEGAVDESDETNNVTCRSVYAIQPGNVVYFVPEDSGASYCNSVDIDLMADVNETIAIIAADVDIVFNGDCVEIANWVGNTTIWKGGTTFSYPGDQPTPPYRKVKISSSMGSYYPPIPGLNGTLHIGTLTLHCNCTEYCETGLDFTYAHYSNATGYASAEPAAQNGTFTCENAPDLVVSEKSEEWIDMVSKTYKVHYTVKNEGNANAGVSNVSLTVDGTAIETKAVSALTQGVEEAGTFDTALTMSGENDTIVVCADCNDDVFEFNEGNNCMENEWTAALKVDIGDYVVTPGSTVQAPVTIYGIQNYGTGTISVAFNKTVAQVTKVDSSSDSTVTDYNIDNSAGIVTISAWNLNGTSGDVIFAYVTFKAVGTTGSSTALDLTVSSLKDTSYMEIPTYTENGSLAIREDAPPVVSDPTSASSTILNDNGRARVPGTNVSQLSVHVADTAGVASVTVNLTPIRGPGNGNDSVTMTRTAGDSKSGIWSLNVTATYDAGVDQTHCLVVNATDVSGNSNTATCILLTVLRRGDVNVGLAHDNKVDMGDALYIARYTVGKEPAPDTFVADVVGAGGAADCYNGVDMGDALYIARYTVGREVEP